MAWSLCSMATSRHARPAHGLVPWLVTIHTVSVLANALSQVWPALIHTLRAVVLAPSEGTHEHRAVPKTCPPGMGRTCTRPASPVCPGLGKGPSPCFIWPFRHRITSFAKCPRGLPKETGTLLGLTLGWGGMEAEMPHHGKTSELRAALGVSDFILMTCKQQNWLN